jgi:3-methyladenine DNA glycosylase AlkD
MAHLLPRIKKELAGYASKEKKEVLQRFFKTGPGEYGEGDVFLGVKVPDIRGTAKKYYKDITWMDIKELLSSVLHEERLLALITLVYRFEKAEEEEREKIKVFYLKNTRYINNWDLVDLTAPNIVGAQIYEKDRRVLDVLSSSKSLWERRIAVLATFFFIRREDFSCTLKLAKKLLNDKEDLMHKAVGWMLREIGKRDIIVLEKFLKKHYKSMPRTMLRYSIERFKEQRRQQYLKGTV